MIAVQEFIEPQSKRRSDHSGISPMYCLLRSHSKAARARVGASEVVDAPVGVVVVAASRVSVGISKIAGVLACVVLIGEEAALPDREVD